MNFAILAQSEQKLCWMLVLESILEKFKKVIRAGLESI